MGHETTGGEGAIANRLVVSDLAQIGYHSATNQRQKKKKWEKEVKKIVIKCWIRSDPKTRKYRQK